MIVMTKGERAGLVVSVEVRRSSVTGRGALLIHRGGESYGTRE